MYKFPLSGGGGQGSKAATKMAGHTDRQKTKSQTSSGGSSSSSGSASSRSSKADKLEELGKTYLSVNS
jgi:hypothetical protein